MKMEHANITVKSIDEAVKFLKLAFPEGLERGSGAMHGDPRLGQWVHFGTDEHYVALQENSQHSGKHDVTYTHDGINHIGFAVEDLDQLIVRMQREGYELSAASAMDSHPHRRRAYIFDGNGVEWEFVEYTSELPEEKNDYSK